MTQKIAITDAITDATTSVRADGSGVNRVLSTNEADTVGSKLVFADGFLPNVDASSAPEYLILVDRSNGSGAYAHQTGSGEWLKIQQASITLTKSSTGSVYEAVMGVVLDISGTDARMGWLGQLAAYAHDSGSVTTRLVWSSGSYPLSLAVNEVASPNRYASIASGYAEITTDLNTASTENDVTGSPQTPEIGDLILRVRRLTGSGGNASATVHGTVRYLAE